MSGNNEIGRVSVKVTPDTRGFAQKTAADLRAIKSKQAKEFQVQVIPDTRKTSAQIDKFIAQENRRLMAQTNRIKFQTALGTGKKEMREQIKARHEHYQGLADSMSDIQFSTNLSGAGADGDGNNASVFGAQKVILQVDADAFGKSMVKAMLKVHTVIQKTEIITEEQAEEDSRRFTDALGDVMRRTKMALRFKLDEKELEKTAGKIREAWAKINSLEGASEPLLLDLDKVNRQIAAQRAAIAKFKAESEKVDRDRRDGLAVETMHLRDLLVLEDGLAKLGRERFGLLTKINKLEPRIDVQYDSILKFEAQVKALKKRIEVNEFEIGVKANLASLEAAAARIAVIARDRIATVWVNVRTSGIGKDFGAGIEKQLTSVGKAAGSFVTRTLGLRLFYQTAMDIFDIVPRLDMLIPVLAKNIGLATVAVSGLAWAFGGLIVVLVESARAFQGLLAAPAILAGLGVAGFVVVQAFKDFNKQLPEVTKQFDALKASVSENFWSTAKAEMQSFFGTAMPLFAKWAPSVSKSVGSVMGALASGLEEGIQAQGERFFKNLNVGLGAAEAGFKSLGSALLTLVGAGSTSFEGLGKWFTGVMGKFDSWAKENDKNGNITRWMNEAADSIGHLGSIILSTLSIFRSMASIFKRSGFPGLEDLDRGLKGVAKTLQDPGFQKKAMYPLEQMNEMMLKLKTLAPEFGTAMDNAWRMVGDTIGTLSGPVTTAIRGILDGFNSDKFQGGFEKFIKGIGSFIEDITPGLKGLTAEFGSLLGIVGTAADSWGPAFNSLLTGIASIGSELHPGLESFIKATGPQIKDLIDDLVPKLEDLAKNFSDLLGDEDFQAMVGEIIDGFETIGGWAIWLGNKIIDLTRWFADFFGKQPEWAQDAMGIAGALSIIALAVAPMAVKKVVTIAVSFVMSMLWQGAQWIAMQIATFVVAKVWPAITAAVGKVKPVLSAKVPVLLKIGVILAIIVGIAAVVKPASITDVVDDAIQATGLKDTWVGDFSRRFREKIDKIWGGKSLLDIVADNFKQIWADFTDGDWWGVIKGIISIPAVGPIKIGELVYETIIDMMFGDGTADAANAAEEEKGLKGKFDYMAEQWRSRLSVAWNGFVALITSWTPPGTFDIVKTIWDWVWDWFTGKSGDGSGATGSSTSGSGGGEDAAGNISGMISGMDGDIISGLQQGWNQLISKILSWSPISTVIDWVKKIIDWLFGLVGIDGDQLARDVMDKIGGLASFVSDGVSRGVEVIKLGLGGLKAGGEGLLEGALDIGASGIEKVKAGFGLVGGVVEGFGERVASSFGETNTQSAASWSDFQQTAQNALDLFGIGVGGAMDGLVGKVGTGTATAKDTGVGNLQGFQALGSEALGILDTDTATKMGSVAKSVIDNSGAARDGGSSAISAMQTSIGNSFGKVAADAVTQGSSTERSYSSAMNTLKGNASGVSASAASSVIGNLTFSLNPQGSSSASTYKSGLSGGLETAAGIASSAAANVKSNLSIDAFNSGAAVGATFAAGLRAKIASVAAAAANVAAAARGALPNSPAKFGPFSGSGWGGWGESIADKLADGLVSGIPAVIAGATSLMDAVSENLTADPEINPSARFGVAARAAGTAGTVEGDQSSAAGAVVQVTVESRGEDPMTEGYRFANDIAFGLKGIGGF